MSSSNSEEVLELNVGGVNYTTSRSTLIKYPGSLFFDWFNQDSYSLPKDSQNRYFIDRDGRLFRYILDFLRTDQLILPAHFLEKQLLAREAQYYKLERIVDELYSGSNRTPTFVLSNKRSSSIDTRDNLDRFFGGYITVGYQGTFSFGPQGIAAAADVNFRKVNRILVSGRVSLCREVFGETLNEGRDPDRGHQNDRDRYTCRYYLKHNMVEYAFDMLAEAGFKLVTSCASGTSGTNSDPKPGSNTEEDRWAHYNEFLFYRE